MKNFFKYLILPIVFLNFYGCEFNSFNKSSSGKTSYYDDTTKQLDFQSGAEYRKQLAMNFNSHSDSSLIKYDFCDSRSMSSWAKLLLAGKNVSPRNPYQLWLPDYQRSELIGSWQFLTYVLKSGGASQSNLANLHFYYECWIDQSENKENGTYSTVCKNQFVRLMNQMINGCKTNFLVEFSPAAYEGSGLSGLALDSSAQGTIYSFLKRHNDQITLNKFLIVGAKEQAIKVANFMNVQGGVEKNRLKIIISDKMDEGNVGLFMDSPETRYCFANSHKKSFDSINSSQTKVQNYVDHNEIKEENQAEKLSETSNFVQEEQKLIKPEVSKSENHSAEKNEEIIVKNDRVVERIK